MSKADTPAHAPSAEEIFIWFNSWLEEPLTGREKTLVRETIYAVDHPNDVEAAKARARLA
jgi:hypothetical protein